MARPVTRRWWLWIITGTLGALMLAGVLVMQWITSPAADPLTNPPLQTIDIPDGSTFRYTSALLANKQIVSTRWGFLLLGRLTQADRRIIPGEYALHGGMKPREILAKLVSGQVVLHPVTIPEGLPSHRSLPFWMRSRSPMRRSFWLSPRIANSSSRSSIWISRI